jgi:DNA modification methylase
MMRPAVSFGRARLFHVDCLKWLGEREPESIHAVVTDPPYGLVEYTSKEQAKLRRGRGGVWRIPPSFDGHQRSPLPRFTTLTERDLSELDSFFFTGAHVAVASNPLVSYLVASAVVRAGLERRGEIVRLVMTLRGGDRPKNAHKEFADVTVMPRSMWEPWLLFRKPLDGRVQDTLRRWGTGGLRRVSAARPFGDVIASGPTRSQERAIAPHPSLKPQAFLRQVVRAILPFRRGVVLDPFAGSGSTLAAAEAVGYESIGLESDPRYVQMARRALPTLAALAPPTGCP